MSKRDEWDVVSEQDGVEIIEPTKKPEMIVVGADFGKSEAYTMLSALAHMAGFASPCFTLKREPVSVTPEILEQVNFEIREHALPPGYDKRKNRPIRRAKGRRVKSKCGFNHI